MLRFSRSGYDVQDLVFRIWVGMPRSGFFIHEAGFTATPRRFEPLYSYRHSAGVLRPNGSKRKDHIMQPKEREAVRKRAARMLRRAGLVITPEEETRMEIADFGLGDLGRMGLEIIVYVNNDRYCAKELILFPFQTCPEHRHPPLSEKNPGKQETFRCRWGTVYLYIPGEPARRPKARIYEKYSGSLTARNEIVLKPGNQYTLPPNTLHWFQAGKNGAVVSEFSSVSVDVSDVFTDLEINRMAGIE